jgi:hypothetical protein
VVPVAGRKPKPEGQARNRTKPTHEWIDIVDEPYAGPRPELPETRTVMTQFGPQDVPLREMTRTWWESASTMPHCILWTPSDWSFALTTAMVADAAFSGGVGAATELRNREKVLGTTVDYRRDLRIRYVDQKPATPQAENVTQMDDYRAL